MSTYAYCLRGTPEGVALLAIHADKEASQTLRLPTPAERYTLMGSNLQDTHVQLNGTRLTLDGNDDPPRLAGAPTAPGDIPLAPASIRFWPCQRPETSACR